MKMGKRKSHSWLSGSGGGFSPAERVGEPAQAAHDRGNGAGGCEDGTVSASPPASEGERNGVTGGMAVRPRGRTGRR
jgi:hypothetical protein